MTKIKNKKMDPYFVSSQDWELQYVADKFATTKDAVREAKKLVGKSRRKIYNWLRLLPVLMMLIGCSQGKPKDKFIPTADTALVLGSYVNPKTFTIANDVLYRLIRDGVTVDSFLVSKRVRDTSYFVWFGQKDKAGKNIYEPVPFLSVSADIRIDTNIARLTRYIKLVRPDTTISK